MEKIKAIFTDSEGTLRNNGKISIETKKILLALKDKNIPVIIATGLPRFMSRKIALDAGTSNYLISSNGADIFDLNKNSSVSQLYLDKEFIKYIYDETKNDYNIILGVGEFEYSNSINEYNQNARLIVNIDDIKENIFQCHISQKNNLNLSKVTTSDLSFLKEHLTEEMYNKFISGNVTLEELKVVLKVINFNKLLILRNKILEYKDLVTLGNQSPSFTNFQIDSESPWFSFNRSGVSKGMAIKTMCDYLEINPKDTVAIGNDYNDQLMIDCVGEFYCPSDAIDSIKDKSDNIYYQENVDKVLKKIYERL